MAYTPVGWQTGDTITADRLNRMDRGWSVDSTQLFSETVTTADNGSGSGIYGAPLAYSGAINADSLTVTYDGTEYTCPRIDFEGECFYGGFNGDPDFTTYPFFIESNSDDNVNAVITETAGEHTVAAAVSALQTSADFDAARGYGYKDTQLFSETVTTADQDGMNVATLAYANEVDASTITVNFDGTEYECPSISNGEYGAPYSDSGFDFTAYPFALKSLPLFPSGIANSVCTQTAGEHTIAVTAPTVVPDTDFAAAVKPIVDDAIASVPTPLLVTVGTTTWAEVNVALKAGRPALVWNHTTQRNQPDTYEFVATARYTSWTVYTLAVSSGAVVVNTYQAASQTGALELVTS